MKKYSNVLLIIVTVFLICTIATAVNAADSTIKGDTNLDGNVTATDLMQIKKHIVETVTLTGQALENADINSNGEVNPTDLLQIKQYLVGIITSLEPNNTATPTPTVKPTATVNITSTPTATLTPTLIPTPMPTKTSANPSCNHSWGNYREMGPSGQDGMHYMTCSKCGITLKEECDYSGAWQTGNPYRHYKTCKKCESLGQSAEHVWESGRCKICGRDEKATPGATGGWFDLWRNTTPTPEPGFYWSGDFDDSATPTPEPGFYWSGDFDNPEPTLPIQGGFF